MKISPDVTKAMEFMKDMLTKPELLEEIKKTLEKKKPKGVQS